MLDFTKLMKFEAKIVVVDDILLDGEVARALISKEFAKKLGINKSGFIKIIRNNSVCFEVKVSEFADGVDVVLPSGYFSAKLHGMDKVFLAEVEKCESADTIS